MKKSWYGNWLTKQKRLLLNAVKFNLKFNLIKECDKERRKYQ